MHMPQLFIIKIGFRNKVNAICGGGQLPVTGSQGPITRVPGDRVPCPRVASPKAQGCSCRIPSLRVPGSWAPGLRSQGLGSQVSSPDFRLCPENVLQEKNPKCQKKAEHLEKIWEIYTWQLNPYVHNKSIDLVIHSRRNNLRIDGIKEKAEKVERIVKLKQKNFSERN